MPGSHGSLTKAGKCRFNTNKDMRKKRIRKKRRPDKTPRSRKDWQNKPIERNYKPKPSSLRANRRKYTKRVIKRFNAGQKR